MKYAYVYKDRTGWWVVEDTKTGEKLGGLHDTELEAYKEASSRGYLVK